MIVIGLSSGTSVDGIDVAVADIRSAGREVLLTPIGHGAAALPGSLRDDVLAALPPASTTMGDVCRLDTGIGRAFADAARYALDELCPGGAADLVASHGQTVFHWVRDGAAHGTLQLGQPAWIAEATGLPVVSDLRARDIAAGGQGAPLASTLDVLWLSGREGTTAALNLGGIANLTVVSPGRAPFAFDTGPANALLDLAAARVGEPMDRDGARARRGRVRPDLLARLRSDPYYARPAPKSTGRELFHADHLDAALAGLDVAEDDLFATLVALTAGTVADACRAHGVTEVIGSGGGMRNPAMTEALRAGLAPARLLSAADHGIDPDAKEAYLFALLGFLTWHGLPSAIPSCTGARTATVAGRITPAARPAAPPDRLRLVPASSPSSRHQSR
ncbi:anhydro-N-acetylmuramic acid kinase [Spinactinospora alkalitolerans]|uniref:Anhydro-N-acetylmuramic acid kinase n=1 Tax=Spinactinospora alkalitolerans TaxID=687207 RepID=A0A852TPZ2_9ACTN|nr:anhydro-N-acetylmuramic acid kinase [Spinactinospora alkalitolerans]NYE45347.1 anhydro-N-acetylmuramic acid kinase [Spinactinospora alkalitolerans]